MKRRSSKHLRYLRNQINIDSVITTHLDIPHKHRDRFLRFLCPLCGEFNTATNPKTNLARCFRCRKNFNPIDLVMADTQCSFLDAVKLLEKVARSHRQISAVLHRR